MTTALVLWLLPTAFTIGFLVGCECCWRWFVVPLRRDPNPFGELPPVQPLGEEPTQYLDVAVVTRRQKPIGIATIAIRHNQPEARN